MANPWIVSNPFSSLYNKRGEYVLKGDETFVNIYNNAHPNDLQLQLMPEPFIGDFCNSKLMILMGNPGYTSCLEDDWHSEKAFLNVIQSSWNHTKPFYYYTVDRKTINGMLVNKMLDWYCNPGNVYWNKLLCEICENLNLCPELVFEAELLPYHSKDFSTIRNSLNSNKYWNVFVNMDSTKYLLQLIQCAMMCDKVIIIARAQALYFKLCPALKYYPHLYVLKSTQGIYFTENNIVNYQLKQNGKSTIDDINILKKHLQNIPECSQECCKKILELLSQSN